MSAALVEPHGKTHGAEIMKTVDELANEYAKSQYSNNPAHGKWLNCARDFKAGHASRDHEVAELNEEINILTTKVKWQRETIDSLQAQISVLEDAVRYYNKIGDLHLKYVAEQAFEKLAALRASQQRDK